MFEIEPSKLADEARLDGIFVLRTNTSITALQVVLHYRDPPQVEYTFRVTKALIRTRPIDHSSDAAIRSHVFCSFPAPVLRKELDERCAKAAFRPGWGDLLRDLDRLQEIEIDRDGRESPYARPPPHSVIGPLFKADRGAPADQFPRTSAA
jgi:hypothetical protein